MPISEENDIAHRIIGFSIDIHKTLGPGLDRSIYIQCLKAEMANHQIDYSENVAVNSVYGNLIFENALLADFMIRNSVLLMIDDSEQMPEYKVAHMIKMLKVLDLKLGLIINFNNHLLRKGIRRVALNPSKTSEESENSPAETLNDLN